MPGQSLGEISVNFVARTRKFSAAINGVTQRLLRLSETAKQVSKSFRGISFLPEFSKDFQEFGKLSSSTVKSFQELRAKGEEDIKVFSSSVENGVKRTVGASTSLGKSIKGGFGQMMKELLSFQSFFAKIIHYITFSIGVQLVMGIRAGIQNVIDTFTEFQRAVVNTAGVSGYLGAAFDSAKNSIIELSEALSRGSAYSAVEVAKALYSLASAGYDVASMNEKQLIPITQFAAAEQIELGQSFELVTKTIKQFKLDFTDTQKVVDTFTGTIANSYATAERLAEGLKYVGSIAGEVGQDLETVNAALAILYDRGLEGGQAGQRLNMIFTKLLKPTDEAKKRLSELGISISDINPYTHDFVDVLYTLKAAGFDAADAAEMFRARTAASAIILVSSADEVANFRDQLRLTQGITENLASRQMNTLWGSFRQLSNEMQIAEIELGKALAPTLLLFTNIIKNDLVPGIKTMASIFSGISSVLGVLAPLLRALIKSLTLLVPIILSLGIYSKILSISFGETGKAAYIAAGGVLSLKTSALSLLSSLFPIIFIMQAVGGASSYLNKSMGILTSAVLIAVTVWKLHLGVIAKQIKLSMVLALTEGNVVTGAILTQYGSLTALTAAYIRHIVITKLMRVAYIGLATILGLSAGILSLLPGQWAANTAAKLLDQAATYGATAAQWALNAAMYACPILAIIAAVSLLIVYWDKIVKAVTGAVRAFTDFIGITKKELVLSKEATSNLNIYSNEINHVLELERKRTKLKQEIIQIEQEYSKTLQDGSDTVEEYANKLDELNEVEEEINNSRQKALEIGKSLLTWISNTSEDLDKVIQSYAKYIEYSNKYITYGQEIDSLEEDKRKALQSYLDAVDEYGSTSEEASTAWDNYLQISKKILDTEKERASANANAQNQADDFRKKEGELNDTERKRFEIAQNIINTQNALIQQETLRTKLQAKEAVLERTLSEWTKILAENSKDLWEKKEKLLDAELKLYKIQRERPTILKTIFDALSKEGMLTKDIINLYKNFMKAQAELTKSRMKYFKYVSTLEPEQQDELSKSMSLFQQLIDAGVDLDKAWKIAFEDIRPEDLGINLEALGIDPDLWSDINWDVLGTIDLNKVRDYADSYAAAADSMQDLGDALSPLLSKLEDMGVLTGQQVEAFHEWLDWINQVNQAQQDVESSTSSLGTEYLDMVDIMARLWQAVGTITDGNWDLKDSWTSILGQLYFLDDSTKSYLSTIDGLNSLLGTTATSWDDFDAATLIAAASILVATNNEGGLITNTSTISSLLDNLDGAPPFDAIKRAAGEALTPTGDLPQTLSDIKEAINKVSGVVGDDATPGSLVYTLNQLNIVLQDIVEQRKETNKPWFQGVIDFFKNNPFGNLPPIIPGWFAEGVVTAQHGFITKGPQLGVIGEAGPEAVVPLAGVNRKEGLRILEYILPRYFPDLAHQTGGVYGVDIPITTGNNVEEYRIMGPVIIENVANVEDFTEQLKFRSRAAAAGR